MDFLDPKKRRAHRIQLFIGYGLMAVAVSASTYLLANITFGYGVDRKTGTIIQNGLIFIDAHPDPATVYLNGENKGTTNARITTPAGNYSLELQRQGYRTWKRGVTVAGGGVERVVHPVLFPTRLVTKDVDVFTSAPGLTTESPDRRWLIVQQEASLTSLDVIDLTISSNTVSNIALPEDIFTAAVGEQHLQAIEWSSDNRHILIKHSFGEALSEYVLIDRELPANSINLSRLFPGQTYAQIVLRDKRADQFYGLSSQASLESLDLKTKQVNKVASQVLAFKSRGSDLLLYATSEVATKGQVSIKLRSANTIFNLRTLPTDTNYFLDLGVFNGDQYALVGAASEGRIYDYKNPISQLRLNPGKALIPISVLKTDHPTMASFSTTGQFVIAQSGSKFAVYDAETDRNYRYDTKIEIDGAQNATWMDDFRITVPSKGRLVVFDYDGTNVQTLSAANAGFTPFFNRDYTALFTVAPSVVAVERLALTRTELKVK